MSKTCVVMAYFTIIAGVPITFTPMGFARSSKDARLQSMSRQLLTVRTPAGVTILGAVRAEAVPGRKALGLGFPKLRAQAVRKRHVTV